MTTGETRMLLRRSLNPGCTPDVSNIYIGELVLNVADGILYARGLTTDSPEGATLFAWPSGLTGFTTIGGSGGIQFTYSDTEPSSANTGDQWFNTNTGYLLTYIDSFWVDLYAGLIGPTGPSGPPGADGPTGPQGLDGFGAPVYGFVGTQTIGTIPGVTTGFYRSTGLTATSDPNNVGMTLGTNDTFAIKNICGETKIFDVYGSYDGTASGSAKTLGLILAKNGITMPQTECRASTSASGAIAKLITKTIVELDDGDEIALFVANHTDTNDIDLQRGRIVAINISGYGPSGPPGPTGSTGPTGEGLFGVTFETGTGITHTINYSTIGTVTGKGRKFPVLLDDGGVTFDYIRTQDIYKDSEFVFSILSFSISGAATNLIGSGNYSMSGRTFTATYTTLGPNVSSASISNNATSSSGYPLALSSPYTSIAATGSIAYPTVSGNSVTFTLGATGSDSTYDTETATLSFRNYTYSGVSSNANLGASGLTGMGSYATELRTNNAGDTFTATAGVGEYVYYAYPSKFGLSSFVVGGFEGGFGLLHSGAVSHTNELGFTENYYIYRSDNANLGVVSVVVGDA